MRILIKSESTSWIPDPGSAVIWRAEDGPPVRPRLIFWRRYGWRVWHSSGNSISCAYRDGFALTRAGAFQKARAEEEWMGSRVGK